MVSIQKQITGLFIYIIGFSGSGKLSTAIELSHMVDALIVSSSFPYNAQIHTVYGDVFEQEKIPKGVQDTIYDITQTMLQVIESYPTKSKNYIFFDELVEGSDHDIRMYNSVVSLSTKMNTRVLPIVLRCNLSTLQKRIELKNKRGNKKIISASNSVERFKSRDLLVPTNAIEIENSNISAREVAEEIMSQAYQFSNTT